MLRAFRHLNDGKRYADQIKPFNFLLTAAGAKPPARSQANHSGSWPPSDGSRRMGVAQIGSTSTIPETGDLSPSPPVTGGPGMARVDTFSDVLAKYETHPESKSLGPDGRPCGKARSGCWSAGLSLSGRSP